MIRVKENGTWILRSTRTGSVVCNCEKHLASEVDGLCVFCRGKRLPKQRVKPLFGDSQEWLTAYRRKRFI